jgi:hypothetical protein
MGFGKTPRLKAMFSGLSLVLSLWTLDCRAQVDLDPPPVDLSPKAQELWRLFFSSQPKYDGMGALELKDNLGFPIVDSDHMNTQGPEHLEFLSHPAVVPRLREGFHALMEPFYELEQEYTERFLPSNGYTPVSEIASQMLHSLDALKNAGGEVRKIPELIADMRARSQLGIDGIPRRGDEARTRYQRILNQQMDQEEYQKRALSKEPNEAAIQAWMNYWKEEIRILDSETINQILPAFIQTKEGTWRIEVIGNTNGTELPPYLARNLTDPKSVEGFFDSVIRWEFPLKRESPEFRAKLADEDLMIHLFDPFGRRINPFFLEHLDLSSELRQGFHQFAVSERKRLWFHLLYSHDRRLLESTIELFERFDIDVVRTKLQRNTQPWASKINRFENYLSAACSIFFQIMNEDGVQSALEGEPAHRSDALFELFFKKELFGGSLMQEMNETKLSYPALFVRGLKQSPDHWKRRDDIAHLLMARGIVPPTGVRHPLLRNQDVLSLGNDSWGQVDTFWQASGGDGAVRHIPTGYFSKVSGEVPVVARNSAKEDVSRSLTQSLFHLEWSMSARPVDLLLTKMRTTEVWAPEDLKLFSANRAELKIESADFAVPDGKLISIPTPKDAKLLAFFAFDAQGAVDTRAFQILKCRSKEGYVLQFFGAPRPIKFRAEFRFVSQSQGTQAALKQPVLHWDSHMKAIVERMEALQYSRLSSAIREMFLKQSQVSLSEFVRILSQATRYTYKPAMPAMDHSETLEGLTRFLVRGDFQAQCDGSASLLRAILNPYFKDTSPNAVLKPRSLFSRVTNFATAGDMHAENELFIDGISRGFLDATAISFAPGETQAIPRAQESLHPNNPGLKPERKVSDFAAMDSQYLASLERQIHALGLAPGFRQLVRVAGEASGANSGLPHRWAQDRFHEIAKLLQGAEGALSAETLLRLEAIAVEARLLWKKHDDHVQSVMTNGSRYRRYPELYSTPVYLALRAIYQRLSEVPSMLQVSDRLALANGCVSIAEGHRQKHLQR